MGAWGLGSMENDYALEWLANQVSYPIFLAIYNTINNYLNQPTPDDILRYEVEAAAALLISYYSDVKEEQRSEAVDVVEYAKKADLLNSSAVAVKRLIDDPQWINKWGRSQQDKKGVLVDLLRQIESQQTSV